MVSEIVDTMEAAIRERLADAASYSAALRGIIEGQVDFFATHTDAVAALASIRAGAQDASTGLSLAIAQREDAVSRLERFFRDGQTAGEFARFDARVMAVSLVGALEDGSLRPRPPTGCGGDILRS